MRSAEKHKPGSTVVLVGLCFPFLRRVSGVLRKHGSSPLWKDHRICSQTQHLHFIYSRGLLRFALLWFVWTSDFTLRKCLILKQLFLVCILLKADLCIAVLYPAGIIEYDSSYLWIVQRNVLQSRTLKQCTKEQVKCVFCFALAHLFWDFVMCVVATLA